MIDERPSIKDAVNQGFLGCFSTLVVILSLWLVVTLGTGIISFGQKIFIPEPDEAQEQTPRASSRDRTGDPGYDSNYGGSSMLRKENRDALKTKLENARDRE